MTCSASLVLALLTYADAPTARVQEQRVGDRIQLVATQPSCFDKLLTVDATLVNMTASPPLPLTVEVKRESSQVLTTLSVIDPKKKWTYKWTPTWQTLRRVPARQAQDFLYALPYRDGPFLVMQGPYGSYSHGEGSQDEEAYDWKMPSGTEVRAARAGVVVMIRQDATEGGPDPKYRKELNYVVVRHDDATFAEYAHLQVNGVRVKVCDKVTTGSVLGLSGNTGFSSEPHLHFAVYYQVDADKRVTLPIKFKDASGAPLRVSPGEAY